MADVRPWQEIPRIEIPEGYFSQIGPFLARMYEQHGPIFRSDQNGHDVIFMAGPEANRFVLLSDRLKFSHYVGWTKIFGVEDAFGNGLLSMDGAEHDAHRKMMNPAFAITYMDRYLPIMQRIIRERIAHMGGARRGGCLRRGAQDHLRCRRRGAGRLEAGAGGRSVPRVVSGDAPPRPDREQLGRVLRRAGAPEERTLRAPAAEDRRAAGAPDGRRARHARPGARPGRQRPERRATDRAHQYPPRRRARDLDEHERVAPLSAHAAPRLSPARAGRAGRARPRRCRRRHSR